MTLFVTRNFLEDMALIMFIAALAANLCRLLRQPLMVGYLITGIVVGPNVPGLYANPERIQSLSNLGVILLVFSMILHGYLVARLRGWTPWESLLTGAMVAFSGAVVLAKALEEVQVQSRVRELVFGMVLCEDLLAILLVA